MKLNLSILCGGVLALALAGCGGGGGGGSSVPVAGSDVKTGASPSTTEVFANTAFTFESGIPSLGTGGTSTNLTFTSGTSFSVSAGGNNASGTTGYGSCVFTVQSTTFASSHPLGVVGNSVRVDPCDIEIKSGGMAASGVPASANARLVLADLASRDVATAIVITSTGQLFVGNALFGSVTVVTGATGGSGI